MPKELARETGKPEDEACASLVPRLPSAGNETIGWLCWGRSAAVLLLHCYYWWICQFSEVEAYTSG